MRRLILTAVLLGGAIDAYAADLPDAPLRGPLTDFVSRTAYWQGIYVGGQYAYGASNADHSTTNNVLNETTRVAAAPFAALAGSIVPSSPVLTKNSQNRSGYGGFIGYNGQWDDVVIGLEGNFVHGDFTTRSSARTLALAAVPGGVGINTFDSTSVGNLQNFATARIRAGYAIGSFLPYAFAGGGLGQADFLRTANVTGTVNGVQTFSVPGNADVKNHFVYGYSFGAGVDVLLIGGLFARAEFEYLRITSQLDLNVSTVRGGIGYKF